MSEENKEKIKINVEAKPFVPKSYGGGVNQNTQGNPNMMGNNMYMNQGYNPYYPMGNNMGGMGMNQGYYNPYGGGNVYNNQQPNNQFNQYNNQQFNMSQYQKNDEKGNTQKANPNEPKKQILTNPNFNQTKDKKKTEKQPQKKEEKKPEKKPVEKKPAKTENKSVDVVNKESENELSMKMEKLCSEDDKIELVTDSKEGEMKEVDETRNPVSIVFIGHVDHGKSTIAGNILILTGMVDERTLEKYQKEAKSKGRDSWYIAYAMDINDDEREKGKTIEIGKAFFKTPTKRFTILDAPGHSGYLPNMLQGACQADFAALVISAKGGEFEAGFEKSGSTREHVLLAKSLGVTRLLVLVNKMDEESVKWSFDRFNHIQTELSVYLKKVGYDIENDVTFIPISGLYGDNVKEKLDSKKCPWYQGPTLLELLDSIDPPKRDPEGPLRISILDRYKEGGMHVMGKVESGKVKFGGNYTLMPNKIPIDVQWVFNSEEEGVPYALPGESVRVSDFIKF